MEIRGLIGLMGALSALLAVPCRAGEDPHLAVVAADIEPSIQVRGRAERVNITEAMASHHVPAVSIAVIDHGQIVWAKAWGYADVAAKTPATPQTVFQAGSISKPVAASAVMQLVQEGKLSLDADINTELKSWQVPASPFTAGKPVTLRGLLTHTAGMTVHGFEGYAAGAPVPTMVQVLDGKPPANSPPVVVDHVPGAAWRYSGGGFTVAQLIMTDVTGQSFPELLRQRVLAPVGMSLSTYEQPLPADRHDGATGYSGSGEPVVGRSHTYPEMAAAGLWTTPTDLAKWVIALQQAWDGRSSVLMRQETAKAMLTSGLGHWGLGVGVDGENETLRFSHGGANEGFRAQMVGYLRGGRGVVVMTNGEGGSVVADELVQAVCRAYGWQGLEARVIDETPLGEAERAGLAGRYAKGQITISSEGDKLWATLMSGERLELVPTGPDRLVLLGYGFELKVVRNAKGAVVRLEGDGMQLPREG